MYYVRARTIGPKGHAVRDHVRGGTLPVIAKEDGSFEPGAWRLVTPHPRWSRLAQMGDIELRREPPPAEECEGYEAPAPVKAKPADKGSDA